jgi:hypothetical protein
MESKLSEELTPEQLEVLGQLYDARKRVTRMLLIGAGWWGAAAIAIAVALSSTGSSILWFGGFLVAATYWWRAFKIHQLTVEAGLKTFVDKEKQILGGVLAAVLISAFALVPEYLKIESPAIGTCWAETTSDNFAPVACWSSNAVLKTVDIVGSESECYSDFFFEPGIENLYTCVDEM